MDKKGICIYVLLAMILSLAVQALMFWKDLPLLVYALLFIPAFSALVAGRCSSWTGDADFEFWPLPKGRVLRMAAVIPLVFAGIHTLTTLFGFSRPDWRLGELMIQLVPTNSMPTTGSMATATALAMPATPMIMAIMGFAFTLVLGPTLCAAALLGMEYGWRGYLLPRLMPLGRWQAYSLVGLLWSLSLAPVFILRQAHSALALLVLLIALAIVLSVILGELWRGTRHIGLTAVCCGCFAAQVSGMWPFLFPESHQTFPWAGGYGVISIVVWALLAAYPKLLTGASEQAQSRNA